MAEISANILADSVSPDGKRLTTFEIVYPRFILAEVNTHKMLEKNSASSRAIPINKMLEQIRSNPAAPVHWGKNQPGMQAKEELEGEDLYEVQEMWEEACMEACKYAEMMDERNAHKQIVNRITEPYQWMKTVITGTEWANFFYLRAHEDAQPEFRELARIMKSLYDKNTPRPLSKGEWHVPYYKNGCWRVDDKEYTAEEALMISASCCAQTSFRASDDSLEKAKKIYDRLVTSKPVHASPFGHQGTPIVSSMSPSREWKNVGPLIDTWEKGVTAYHKQLGLMSGNLAGWIQYRQLLPDHTVW